MVVHVLLSSTSVTNKSIFYKKKHIYLQISKDIFHFQKQGLFKQTQTLLYVKKNHREKMNLTCFTSTFTFDRSTQKRNILEKIASTQKNSQVKIKKSDIDKMLQMLSDAFQLLKLIDKLYCEKKMRQSCHEQTYYSNFCVSVVPFYIPLLKIQLDCLHTSTYQNNLSTFQHFNKIVTDIGLGEECK